MKASPSKADNRVRLRRRQRSNIAFPAARLFPPSSRSFPPTCLQSQDSANVEELRLPFRVDPLQPQIRSVLPEVWTARARPARSVRRKPLPARTRRWFRCQNIYPSKYPAPLSARQPFARHTRARCLVQLRTPACRMNRPREPDRFRQSQESPQSACASSSSRCLRSSQSSCNRPHRQADLLWHQLHASRVRFRWYTSPPTGVAIAPPRCVIWSRSGFWKLQLKWD